MARFQAGRNKLVKCASCKKLTHSSVGGNVDINLCRTCLDFVEWSNSHTDDGHDNLPEATDGCPVCAGHADPENGQRSFASDEGSRSARAFEARAAKAAEVAS